MDKATKELIEKIHDFGLLYCDTLDDKYSLDAAIRLYKKHQALVSKPFDLITSCGVTFKKCNTCGSMNDILD